MDKQINIKCICGGFTRQYKTKKGRFRIYCFNCSNSTRYRKTEELVIKEWVDMTARQAEANIKCLENLRDFNNEVLKQEKL